MKKDSKIYVAGHTGLVGSAIVRNLRGKGYNNLVFTPYPEYDLIEKQVVENFFKQEKPEYVFLAAAKVGGIVANNTYRGQFIYENLQIQNNVIHSSYLNEVKKLLFLGSSCIYPKNCDQPIREEYLLTDILEYTNESYAIAKIAGIKTIESYNLQYGTNFISVMPTNLYGINDNFDLEKSHVLPALIRKMHLGKSLFNNDFESIKKDLDKNPIEKITGDNSKNEIIKVLEKYGILKDSILLWGSGKPRREFLHSDDLADACVYLMKNIDFIDILKNQFSVSEIEYPYTKKEIRNTHINIGTGRDISILELSELIKEEIVEYKGQIKWDSEKPDGTFQKILNVSKLHSYGWHENIKFKDGLKNVYENYCKYI
jgi:GDP-L-fucose synthase